MSLGPNEEYEADAIELQEAWEDERGIYPEEEEFSDEEIEEMMR